MSETPKLPRDDTLNDLATIKDILYEFVDETRTPAQIKADEVSRKKAADIVDAKHGVQSAKEARQQLIERQQAGEDILPEEAERLGGALLEAVAHAQDIVPQDQPPFDNPTS